MSESATDRAPLSRDQKRALLAQLLRQQGGRSPARPVHELFEAQAERAPNAAAVSWGGQTFRYHDINRQANQLAHRLRALGVGPEIRVGLFLDRGVEMIVGQIAIFKAGGIYVPLNPTDPPERLAWQLQDARLSAFVTQEGMRSRLPSLEIPVVCLDRDQGSLAGEPVENPRAKVEPEHGAYVIYTSGSTGAPKGVLVEHRGLSNLIAAQVQVYEVGADSRVLQFASPVFDASVGEVWRALSRGACLCLPPSEARLDLAALLEFLRHESVTHATLAPALVAALPDAALPTLGTLIVGGESCPAELVTRWAPGRRFFNAYGPTEATVCVTIARCLPDGRKPSIGRPIANTNAYVLDSRGQLAPVGLPGELYLGGVCLARGYLGRPALTAERFVPCPFGDRPGARLYRTGDLCRWLPDGNLEFLGRTDQQVKVRGFRVELGEVEATLAKHANVRQAVVVVREHGLGQKRLVGYVVASAPPEPTPGELRAWLQRSLPDYMVPSAFVWLPALPLTPNGKVDRQALPAPEERRSELESVDAAPSKPTEEVLAGIWAGLLKLDRVGVRDNFFELGGHSLLATQVVSRVRETLGVELPLRAMFEVPTVAGLASLVETLRLQQGGLQAPPLVPVSRDQPLPLSFAQQGLWFLHQWEPDSPAYNIPAVLPLRGPLHLAALQEAFREVIRRHEALRTRFPALAGQPTQVVVPPGAVELAVLDLTNLPDHQRQAQARQLIGEHSNRPFDLTADPPWRAKLLRLASSEDHLLLLTVHHIISDGWSHNVLMWELTTLYRAFSAGRPSPLPDLAVQYADFAVWQRAWLQGEVLQRHLDYWRKRLQGIRPLDLPTDHPRPAVLSFRGARQSFTVSTEVTAKLKALSRQQGTTLFMTLLAAYQALLARHSGQGDVAVGTPIAGRSRQELEGLIGFFVNTLVLRTDLSGDPTFLELLGRVREVCLGAYTHQDLPFEKLVDELQPQRDPSRNPLFQVLFALQNTPRVELRLAEPTAATAPPHEPDRKGPKGNQAWGSNGTAKFDLGLQLLENAQGLTGSLGYSTDLFNPETAARFVAHYVAVLEEIALHPEQRLSTFSLLAEGEQARLQAMETSTCANGSASSGTDPEQWLHRLDQLSEEEVDALLGNVEGDEEGTHE